MIIVFLTHSSCLFAGPVPVLLYPCVFCINAVSGQQLEVASGLQTPNQFRSILQNAFMVSDVVIGLLWLAKTLL